MKLDRPSLRAYELDDGSYAEVAHVSGSEAFRASKPFAVEVVPDRLVDKLRRRLPRPPAAVQVTGRGLAGHRC
jgi:hypothetical protein